MCVVERTCNQPFDIVPHDAPPKFDDIATIANPLTKAIKLAHPAHIASSSFVANYASKSEFERERRIHAIAFGPASPTIPATSPHACENTPYSAASETVFARSPSADVEDVKMVEESEEDEDDEASVAGGERKPLEDAGPTVTGRKNKQIGASALADLFQALSILTKT